MVNKTCKKEANIEIRRIFWNIFDFKKFKDLELTNVIIYHLVIVIVDPLIVQYERGLDANGYVQNRESSKDGIFEHFH